MKQYKAFIIGFILAVIPINSAYGILGFGVQGGQGLFTVGARSLEDPSGIASMATAEFSNSLNFGLYGYLDIIPFFDLEVDANIIAQVYEFAFLNVLGTAGPYDAVWGGASTYITARRKLVGFGIPFIGKTQIFAGGGFNNHTFAPLANLDLVESLMGGDLTTEPTFSEDDLVDFINENKIDKSGLHFQVGMQFKLLVLDSFLFYRHTLGDFDDVLDAKSFGSLNIRIGMGF
ncbi:MAG: hypothetical protein CMG15_01130 [Candidatus Marinimicrobia bacterium]|jgi:hypothetical protein|nr:hypothetical protein [Candidatus Neomarinimicrobiota bacterium]